MRQRPVAVAAGVVAAVDEDALAVDEGVLAVDEDVLIVDEDVHEKHAQALGSATSLPNAKIFRPCRTGQLVDL